MTRSPLPAALPLAFAACLLALSCASATRVYVNPDADMAFYKKVAVLPFTNISPDGFAGARVTRSFITSLIMTNRYEIVQPEEFRGVLAKLGGPGSDGTYEPARLKEAAGQLGATSILRGAVSEYSLERSEGGDIPILSFDAELVDVNTGNVVWRSFISKRGKSRIPVIGSGSRSLGRLTQEACDELVGRLRKEAL